MKNVSIKEIDVKRLHDVMIFKNMGYEYLSKALNMDRSTLYRKLVKGASAISLKDYIAIRQVLELSDAEAKRIFGV